MAGMPNRHHVISCCTTRPLAQRVLTQPDKWEDRLSVQLFDSPRF